MEKISDRLVYGALGLGEESKIAEVLTFFIKDIVEIMLLLVAITFFMGFLRHYLPIEKLRDFLAKRKLFGADYFLATVFGAITPFCSCSSIPLFIGFVKAGIPLGVTFSFLITSPLINEVALTLFIGLFGWKITLVYVVAGILIGMVGGCVLGKLNLERYVEDYIWKIENKNSPKETQEAKILSWEVMKDISRESFSLIRKIGIYVLIGVALGAIIHGYVPEGFFEKYITKSNPFAVPLAVILAVPLYSNASGVLPIIDSLVAKGIPLGTALAFMMATVGLSLPEALILRKVMKLPLLLTFFGVVAFGMILIGYGFNLIF